MPDFVLRLFSENILSNSVPTLIIKNHEQDEFPTAQLRTPHISIKQLRYRTETNLPTAAQSQQRSTKRKHASQKHKYAPYIFQPTDSGKN